MRIWVLVSLILALATTAWADVVTDANAKAADIASRHPATPPAVRIMAIVQVSVFEAVNAITAPLPADAREDRRAARRLGRRRGRRRDADGALEAHADAAGGDRGRLSGRPETGARRRGEDRRDRGRRAGGGGVPGPCEDGMGLPDTYRPHTTAGVYVPTLPPAVPNWGKRKPWVHDQRRPVPAGPPARPDQRDVGAGLQRDQGDRREEQHPAHARSKPPSPSSGKRRLRPSTGRWRARSPPCPAVT